MKDLLERLYENEQRTDDTQMNGTYDPILEEKIGYQEPERLFAMYFKGFGPKKSKGLGGFGSNGFGSSYLKPFKPNPGVLPWRGDRPPQFKPAKTGFGSNCGLGSGYVYDNFKVGKHELSTKVRADKPHKGFNKYHLNIDPHYHKGPKRRPIINPLKSHIAFDWRKKKKW